MRFASDVFLLFFRRALSENGRFSRGRFASAIFKEFFLGRILFNGPFNSHHRHILENRNGQLVHRTGESARATKQVLLQNGPQKAVRGSATVRPTLQVFTLCPHLERNEIRTYDHSVVGRLHLPLRH